MSKTIPNIDDDWVEDFKMKLITYNCNENVDKMFPYRYVKWSNIPT